MVRTFTLDTFSDDTPITNESEFVTFFQASNHAPASGKKADLESQARKVFEDAFAQGEKAGYDLGMQKVEALIKRLNTYIEGLDAFREKLLGKSEELSVNLALIFAETIILKECSEHREILMDMARKALEICDEKGSIVIRMSRDDAKYISKETTSTFTVVPDDTLKEPGFLIETGFGDIDGRISTQIEELAKKVFDGYRK
jgi:flagellar biosynthesis/type III secretory pathway protein FliH